MASTLPYEAAPIKYESPYSAEPRASSVPSKRPQSEFLVTADSKRLRTEPQPAANSDADLDFDRLLEEAAMEVMEGAAAESTMDVKGVGMDHRSTSFDMPSVAGSMPNHPEYHGATGNGSPYIEARDSVFFTDPYLSMRICSLPALESLAVQIVARFSHYSYSEVVEIFSQPQSDQGQAYATLKGLFDANKSMYSKKDIFLSADRLNIPEHRETIRMVNLATFLSSVFGETNVGYQLNDHFLETFVAHGAEVPKDVADLLLNLKTQLFLSAISQEELEDTKEGILERLFPSSLGNLLRARHPDTDLLQSEMDFVSDAHARREYLRVETEVLDAIPALSEQYSWETFLQDIITHVKETYETLGPYMTRHGLMFPVVPQPDVESNNAGQDLDVDLSFMEAIDKAGEEALANPYGDPKDPGSYALQQQQQQTPPIPNNNDYAPVPYHTQSAPTQYLYEKARQVAMTKTCSSHSRRPGLPSQRRPWSTDEENALMRGLDEVKGPHWSSILVLFGNRGTISQVLKDRNQVQLKDKARNLKLFFLKNGIEVPYYLQMVTGELKTRAPTQAARKEAEERARVGTEEEQRVHSSRMTPEGSMQIQAEQDHGTPQTQTYSQAQTFSPAQTYSPAQMYSPASAQRSYQAIGEQMAPHVNHNGALSTQGSMGQNTSHTVTPQPQQSPGHELDFEGELGQRLKESMARENEGPQAPSMITS